MKRLLDLLRCAYYLPLMLSAAILMSILRHFGNEEMKKLDSDMERAEELDY